MTVVTSSIRSESRYGSDVLSDLLVIIILVIVNIHKDVDDLLCLDQSDTAVKHHAMCMTVFLLDKYNRRIGLCMYDLFQIH